MVNRKCRMLFKSLCISMSVMMAATPIAPCFQAAETQTEAQTQEAGSSQTEAPDSGKEASETEQAKQENPESGEKESESRDTETETGTVQSMDADSADNQTQSASEHTVTIEGGESTDGTTVYHAGDTGGGLFRRSCSLWKRCICQFPWNGAFIVAGLLRLQI